MTTFRNAYDHLTAEVTPRPWEYTTPDGTTLTVIPAGLAADRGCAEVMVRITAGRMLAVEAGITTADLPGLVGALDLRRAWEHTTLVGDMVDTAPQSDGGVLLTVTKLDWPDGTAASRRETTAAIRLPAKQRSPLASALRRAGDVAEGWED